MVVISLPEIYESCPFIHQVPPAPTSIVYTVDGVKNKVDSAVEFLPEVPKEVLNPPAPPPAEE